MDLNIQDWMMVIGVLLVLAVALDGYRRARRERNNQVRLSRNAKRAARKSAEESDKENYTSELPGGGARVISRRESEVDPLSPPEIASERIDPQFKKEPTFSLDDDLPLESQVQSPQNSDTNAVEPESYSVDPLFADPFKAGKKEKMPPVTTDEQEVQSSLFDTEAQQSSNPEEIIALNVLASSSDGFAGEDLLHILLACDCRFGEMNIFHRYESENATGEIQFSIVNVVEPGVFKLDDIKSFTTPGVSFFLRLPGPKDPIEAFNCMVETAQCLVRNLDGELTDEAHCSVTEQTLEHSRQRIRDFLKNQLVGV